MCKKCFCSIIPPDILNKLAKSGSVESKKALVDLERIRQKRTSILGGLLNNPSIEGNAEREVYDSQNTPILRHKFVRGENDPPTNDIAVDTIHKVSGFVRQYFLDTFNYNSLNNKGMNIILNVHYNKNYNNAFWDGDEMAFGDGDGKFLKDFALSVDVIAHELMHGITQHLANLEYANQSGALNEHFSDVFGTIIRQKYNNQTVEEADWLIGKEIIGNEFPGVALRSMKAPGTANAYDRQPNHMDNYYNGTDDGGGVHINSGIPNKAFYLAATELGIDYSALIWFECLKKLWKQANFQDMLDVILDVTQMLACKDLVPKNAYSIVEKAFQAVGLKQVVDLKYKVEVSGGVTGISRTLEGALTEKDSTLQKGVVSEIINTKVDKKPNTKLRDGLHYKFWINNNVSNHLIEVDENGLSDNLKKLVDAAKERTP